MSTATDGLGAAIDSENAAVFVYGVAVAYASATRRSDIDDFTAEHRSRRDELEGLIVAAGGTAPAPAPGYVIPVAVTDPITAIRAVLLAEEDCARAYRSLLERADTDAQRRSGLDGLTDSARRAAAWRLVLRVSPSTVALPGTGNR
ncbi:ferritin-like domain-containing protein [Williamsia sp.]|uniref:ferritin-like domain-containing protein n=1 Tax=Williamsia sp. TaxID=1872085 RepID=UPI001A1B822B|nr:ferritin-like domain-containing protein [Williamsia sp.]MBJ7287403.1 ferritin-like domain-containing protein [Williamsia sp.]